MSCLIPKLFRNIIAAPFQAHTKEKLQRAITTIALGALMAASVQAVKSIPFAGTIIMTTCFFIDSSGFNCAAGILTSYQVLKMGSQAIAYLKSDYPLPPLLIPLLLLCIGIAWYCFNEAGNQPQGYLRPH